MTHVTRLILLLLAFPLTSLAEGAKTAPTEIAACRAALNVEHYPALPISPDLQQTIASYRTHWRRFCQGDRTVSLSTLLIEAQNIEERFHDVFSHLNDEIDASPGERGDEVHHALTIDLPAFVPAFMGWYMEYAQFRPVLVDFTEASALGTEDDVRFFEIYTPLHGDTGYSPWIKKETDVSGCVRFGEYDWVAALKTAARLRQETTSAIYRQLIDRFRSDLLETLSATRMGQACGDGRHTLSDLLAVSDYLTPRDAAAARTIEQAIDAIRAGSSAAR